MEGRGKHWGLRSLTLTVAVGNCISKDIQVQKKNTEGARKGKQDDPETETENSMQLASQLVTRNVVASQPAPHATIVVVEHRTTIPRYPAPNHCRHPARRDKRSERCSGQASKQQKARQGQGSRKLERCVG